ncbi:MAG: hypothetical protein ACTHOJ_08460 [Sphingomonas oligoaromativorans]
MRTDLISVPVPADATLAARLAVNNHALARVLRERVEQIDRHGYSPEHDLDHEPGELACAALAYLMMGVNLLGEADSPPTALHEDVLRESTQYWPWMDGFRPSLDPAAMLAKAAALLLATMDRIDIDAIPAGSEAA